MNPQNNELTMWQQCQRTFRRSTDNLMSLESIDPIVEQHMQLPGAPEAPQEPETFPAFQKAEESFCLISLQRDHSTNGESIREMFFLQ